MKPSINIRLAQFFFSFFLLVLLTFFGFAYFSIQESAVLEIESKTNMKLQIYLMVNLIVTLVVILLSSMTFSFKIDQTKQSKMEIPQKINKLKNACILRMVLLSTGALIATASMLFTKNLVFAFYFIILLLVFLNTFLTKSKAKRLLQLQ